jgi:hypothetical protein
VGHARINQGSDIMRDSMSYSGRNGGSTDADTRAPLTLPLLTCLSIRQSNLSERGQRSIAGQFKTLVPSLRNIHFL